MILQGRVTDWKRYVSTTTMPVVTKLGMMVVHLSYVAIREFGPVKLRGKSNMLYLFFHSSTNRVRQPVSHVASWNHVTSLKRFISTSTKTYEHKVTWPFNQVIHLKLRDKSKKLYLNIHKIYCHQTWQGIDLGERSHFLFGHMAMWGYPTY